MTKAISLGKVVIVENPKTSRIWKAPIFQKLLRSSEVLPFDFCGYGFPWQKSTSLAVWNLPVSEVLRTCKRGEKCQYSGLKHMSFSTQSIVDDSLALQFVCIYNN